MACFKGHFTFLKLLAYLDFTLLYVVLCLELLPLYKAEEKIKPCFNLFTSIWNCFDISFVSSLCWKMHIFSLQSVQIFAAKFGAGGRETGAFSLHLHICFSGGRLQNGRRLKAAARGASGTREGRGKT